MNPQLPSMAAPVEAVSSRTPKMFVPIVPFPTMVVAPL
jgi:hypothetical protein